MAKQAPEEDRKQGGRQTAYRSRHRTWHPPQAHARPTHRRAQQRPRQGVPGAGPVRAARRGHERPAVRRHQGRAGRALERGARARDLPGRPDRLPRRRAGHRRGRGADLAGLQGSTVPSRTSTASSTPSPATASASPRRRCCRSTACAARSRTSSSSRRSTHATSRTRSTAERDLSGGPGEGATPSPRPPPPSPCAAASPGRAPGTPRAGQPHHEQHHEGLRPPTLSIAQPPNAGPSAAPPFHTTVQTPM